MRALANEIAKNLVLAGIGSLTVQDSGHVSEDDLGAQFFVFEEDVGKNVRHHRNMLLSNRIKPPPARIRSCTPYTKVESKGFAFRRSRRYQAEAS